MNCEIELYLIDTFAAVEWRRKRYRQTRICGTKFGPYDCYGCTANVDGLSKVQVVNVTRRRTQIRSSATHTHMWMRDIGRLKMKVWKSGDLLASTAVLAIFKYLVLIHVSFTHKLKLNTKSIMKLMLKNRIIEAHVGRIFAYLQPFAGFATLTHSV